MSALDGAVETLAGGVVRALAGLPHGVQRALTSRRTTSIDGLELEPEVALALMLVDLVPGASFEKQTPAEARETIRRDSRLFGGPRIDVGIVEDREIPGPGGPIGVRIYEPRGRRLPSPLIVYYHGGGWVTGDLETHDNACRFLAGQTRCSVVAVDYRLAPEHPYPAAVDDALAAFRWVAENAEDLGADAARLAVVGDSAGGTLAAVVSRVTTADAGPAPALQVLVYPVTDLSTKTRSYDLFAEGFFLTEAQMDWYRDHYIGDTDGKDARISPLLAEDLLGLPPAYVTTAGFDVLRDEGEEYARKLERAGVAVTADRLDGMVHGWVNAISLGRSARRAADRLVDAIRTGLNVGQG